MQLVDDIKQGIISDGDIISGDHNDGDIVS